MKLTIDTKEDSHDDLRKVIKMLQHIVGDAEVFTNQPSDSSPEQSSPIANIFGDNSAISSAPENNSYAASTPAEASVSITPADEAQQSTEDLFAELFNEEELKKMEPVKEPEDEDEEEEIKSKAKSKRPDIEFY